MAIDLQAFKELYDEMNWDDFRENAGDLITREIDIYNGVLLEGVPALIAEVERLREALGFYANEEKWSEWDEPSEFECLPPEAIADSGMTARIALGVSK